MKRMGRALAALFLALALSCGTAAGTSFPDVSAGAWYASVVEEMAAQGILKGLPDGSFHPEDAISAAEFVTIAARCTGAAPESVSSGHWAAGSMEAALGRGWYDWDELPPTGEGWDKPISRQLAVKVLMKALLPGKGYDYTAESSKIKDFSALNGRYYDTTLAACAAGVVTGDGAGNFRPLDGLTRAEACALFQRALSAAGGVTPQPPAETERPSVPAVPSAKGGVTENGWLQVVGTQLCNARGEPIVLHGMSSHGLQWYGQYASAQAMANTAAYGANVFRVAMYTGEGGYLSQPEAMTERAFAAVDAAIQADLYAILDWHILSDGDPMANVAAAESFFAAAAERYKDTPNVLYEICNEPNGNVTWAGNVKPYAQRLVSAIRAQAPKSVILIGSPTWSQDIHQAAADPVAGENLMYTLHFYAGTHGQELRQRIDAAMAAGLPVFVSEWGASRADGSGGVFLEESKVWLDFLAERGVSWCNWSLCDKNETPAPHPPGTAPAGSWTEDDLTESGRFVFSRF